MKRTKDEALEEYKKAKAAGKYMVAVWHVQDEKLNLYRLTKDFPLGDIPEALRLLRADLEPITMKGPDD